MLAAQISIVHCPTLYIFGIIHTDSVNRIILTRLLLTSEV